MHSLTVEHLTQLRFDGLQLSTLRALGEYRGKQKLFVAQPGWTKYLFKLVLAVLVMSAVLLGLMQLMPAWDHGNMLERFIRLGGLVVAGVLAYFGMLLLLGLRLKDFARKSLM